MALPYSAGYQARIDQANAGLVGLAAQFSPRRRSLAFDTAAGLNQAGYFRDAMPEEVTEGGNIVYRLTRGPDGRLYQQAFRQVASAHAGRGTFRSSFRQRDDAEQRRNLNAARDAIMRQFGQQQADSVAQQAAEDARLRGELGQARGEYADWQAAQPAPIMAPPGVTGNTGALGGSGAPMTPGALSLTAPARPSRPAAPRPSMAYADFLRGRTSTRALAGQWRDRFGGS